MIHDEGEQGDLGRAVARRFGRQVTRVSPATERCIEEVAARVPNATPAELLGAAFESGMPNEERRGRGTHYTPATLAREVVLRTFGDAAVDADDPPRVLDPAMGAGIFLEAALDVLVHRSQKIDSPSVRAQLARSALHGIDLDPRAVTLARWTLAIATGEREPRPDDFADTLVLGDALLDDDLDAHRGVRWQHAFARAFEGARPGFDLVIGNPPFLGGKRIRTIHGDRYAAALAELHAGANKNTDLAAHFLRRAFDHLAEGGALGFIVTSSISEGDTREGGLSAIVREGGVIYGAETARTWPGSAAVKTSLLWIQRGGAPRPCVLDGEAVDAIDPWLTSFGSSQAPPRRAAMKGRAFIGCFLRGKGFVFDDAPSVGDASMGTTSTSIARTLLAQAPTNAAVIRPFLGGEEITTHPEHAPHRWVIAFGGRSLEEAQAFPDALAIVEQKVRPFREARRSTDADARHRDKWWLFANHRPELERAMRGLDRVIVIPRMTSRVVAVMVPTGPVFSDQLVVVASRSFAVLALLSSRAHALWTHRHASTLGAGLRYTPSDVFETFPLPFETFEALEASASLAAAGEAFHEARRAALAAHGVGLRALRAREAAPADAHGRALREATKAVDDAVLDAFGWGELARSAADDHDDATRSDRELLERLLVRSRAPLETGVPSEKSDAGLRGTA